MKVLVVSNRIPAAERKGDQVVSYYRVIDLAKMGYKLEIVCFGDSDLPENKESLRVLRSAGINVTVVKLSFIEAFKNFALAFFNPAIPFQCAIFESKKIKEKIALLCALFKPDALYFITIRAFVNAPNFKGKVFGELIDSIGLNFQRRVAASHYLKRLILDVERKRVSRYEKQIADSTERSFVVSDIDRKYIDSAKVDVIPLGIDTELFKYKQREKDRTPVIVFTGNMHYQPNIDAVLWFNINCWKDLKAAIPSVRFIIAGSNPHASILSLAKCDSMITVTGRVPSISDVLNSSTISIAPMQSGSGMQFKILEAMACGIPVVTTSLGLGDIKAEVGSDLLLADSPESFVESILSLLESPDYCHKIGMSGLHYVKKNHSWHALNSYFESQLSYSVPKHAF